MPRFDTHVCLVSAQATPNLSPAIDPDFKPRRVVLAVSKGMERQAAWLTAVLRRHALVVEQFALDDPFDFYGCCDQFTSWLSEQGDGVALNVTGGTKVMAMAAQEVFRGDKRPVFYVNVDNDQLLFIDRAEPPFVLPTKIKLREYLEVHGYTLPKKPERPEIRASLREFARRLCSESERMGQALGRLNSLAQGAMNSLVSPAMDDREPRNLNELVANFANEGLLSEKDGRLHFPDEAARFFVNGGWLEYVVSCDLSDLRSQVGMADCAIGLEVLAPDGQTRNELDACFLYHNTLHIIECKSANLAISGKTADSRATESLYKLDALRRIGGLRTKAMLIDYRGSLDEHDRRRASQLGISIASGRELRDLKGKIKAWLA